MSGQIIFFKKSKSDYSYTYVTATASEGSAYATYVLNRNNTSSWITTGSTDASLTTLTIDFSESRTITDILLLKHNFKSFTVKYWDGSAYQAFSPAISETTNTADDNYYEVTSQATSKIQITINSTQVVDSDKYLFQFIATEKIGRLNGWPVIKKPVVSRNRKKTMMLSGKQNIFENVGGFSCNLTITSHSNAADLTVIETLYGYSEGFLVWPGGGVESQFRNILQGYRMEDIFLMKCSDEYSPEYHLGMYALGTGVNMRLEEVIN